MLLQVSPAWIVYSVTQPGSRVAAGEADDVDDAVLAAETYGGGEVKAYPVLEQDEVSDTWAEAKSRSYPNGELSCIWATPSMQSEHSCAAVSWPEGWFNHSRKRTSQYSLVALVEVVRSHPSLEVSHGTLTNHGGS